MTVYKYLFFSLLFLTKLYFATGQTIKCDIQYVTIEDSFLEQTIDSLITVEEKSDSLFAKGYGYFLVWKSNDKRSGEEDPRDHKYTIDTVSQYSIMVSFGHPEKEINELMSFYPEYFSVVNGRVVVIYLNNLGEAIFSDRSKEMYLSYLEHNLAPEGDSSRKMLWKLSYEYEIYHLEGKWLRKPYKPMIRKGSLLVKNK